jgi:hypothetical protein
MQSVAVASVRRLDPATSGDTCGVEGCSMLGSGIRHGHFMVQIGQGFMGVLEQYAIEGEAGRTYDFDQKLDDRSGKIVEAARKQGQLVTVNLLVKVFGPARWSRLSSKQQNIIQGLVREITRRRGKKVEGGRDDNGDVLVGNRLPATSPNHRAVCNLLDRSGNYMAFNGNGRRRGMGYRVIGVKGTGWLAKCGYQVPSAARERLVTVRGFLHDVEGVARILGLTVMGFHRPSQRWVSLETLQVIASQRSSITRVEQHDLRIYGPTDYHQRLRRYLEDNGQMRIPKPGDEPGTDGEEPAPHRNDELLVKMKRLGVTHRQLGEQLGHSQQFVSQVLGGRRPWPEGLLDRAEAYLEGLGE